MCNEWGGGAVVIKPYLSPPFWKRVEEGGLEHDICKTKQNWNKDIFTTPKIKILLSGPISPLFMTR